NLDTLDEPEARAAMIWIIGQYADRIDNSDRVLATFLETFLDDPAEVQLAMLTAVVKLFIMRPTAGQEMVPKVLKWATEHVDSPDIRDRGFIYWRLLSTDPEMARAVVLSDKPEISAEGERLDMPLLEELLLQVGTLSSIYRKPPCTFIPFAKKRVLGASEALTRLTIAPPPVSRLPRSVSVMKRPTSAKQQQQAVSPTGDHDGIGGPSGSSSVQLSASALDVTNGGNSGMSNPYINDTAAGFMQGNDAVLIDLMSMDDDEYGGDSSAAINSGGMAGFNASFGLMGMNMASMDPAARGASVGAAPDSQVLNSAFDAAGLDALANVASPLARLSGRSGSPMPDLMRQFTSSFDLSSGANTAGASFGTSGSMGAIPSPMGNLSFAQHQQSQPVSGSTASLAGMAPGTAPYGVAANASSMPALLGTTTAASFPSVLSPTSAVFNIPTSTGSPFANSASILGVQGNQQPLSAPVASNTLLFSPTGNNNITASQPVVSESAATAFKKEVDDLATQMYNSTYLGTSSGSGGVGSGSSTGNSMSIGTATGTGNNTGTGSVTYAAPKNVLLDSNVTHGLEILGTFARRSGGKMQMEMTFANKSNMPISDFAIQFNKNTYGLMPSGSLGVGTVAALHSVEVTLPLTLGGPAQVMQPLNNLQIAIKCTAGVFYFATQYSLHILFDEKGNSDQGEFLRMWKTLEDVSTGPLTVRQLRFTSMEMMRDKLNMNNVFTVAQRVVDAVTHFYTSSKMADGSVFYSEIKVANDFQVANIVTKSTAAHLVPLYQKAISDICTAF
ncbi:hypothetical protein LPJ73_002399, partial [Coemansia sp. RSA 2703]